MPHKAKDRKKHGKYIAARQSRFQRLRAAATLAQSGAPRFARALRLPVLAALTYALLFFLTVMTPLALAFHYGALALFALWIVQAVRGELGFFSHRAHLRFFLPIVAFVFAGSCFGGAPSDAAKAWVTPPPYAGKPVEQLTADGQSLPVLTGSTIHVGWQGTPQSMSVRFGDRTVPLEAEETNEATMSLPVLPTAEPRKTALVLYKGWRRLGLWTFTTHPDNAPTIALSATPEITARGTVRVDFAATDDYGVEVIALRVAPTTLGAASAAPVEMPLLKPAMKKISTSAYADLTSLPWAGQVVSLQLVAVDGAGHRGLSAPKTLSLPTRSFRNPFAKALIEERAKLLVQPDAALRDEAANVMAGIARQQGLYQGDKVVMMVLRAGAARLVLNQSAEVANSVAQMIWQAALRLEDGLIGLAREEMAQVERDLSFALMRSNKAQNAMPHWLRLQEAMVRYLEVLEGERARQPPALQEVDWPLATAQEMLAPEDLQNRVASIGASMHKDDPLAAMQQLSQLQSIIENLRTSPPDLTLAQSMLAQQVSALRALVRGQKVLNEETDLLGEAHPLSARERKALADGLARTLAQQQLLIAAMQDIMGQAGLPAGEGKAALEAMKKALSALQRKGLSEVQGYQANALALLQNILLSLSDQMKRALAAQAP